MTIGVISLGCVKNRVDTEQMLALLTQAGHTITADPAEADTQTEVKGLLARLWSALTSVMMGLLLFPIPRIGINLLLTPAVLLILQKKKAFEPSLRWLPISRAAAARN